MDRKMGCLKSPKDFRDYKVATAIRAEILPEEFRLSDRIIKDQGLVGSCVAHSLSSALEKNNQIFSTGWIYGYRPMGYYQGEGMYIREALKTVQKIGAVKQPDFPHNIEMMEAKQIVDKNLLTLKTKAQEFQIEAYAKLNTIVEIKNFIYTSKTPVIFAVKVGTNYLDLDKNNIIIVPKDLDNNNVGNHAMIIIGWTKDGFIIQNSWGELWGKQGIAILPYDYPIDEAWGITISKEESKEDNIEPEEPFIIRPNFYILRQWLQTILNIFIRKK